MRHCLHNQAWKMTFWLKYEQHALEHFISIRSLLLPEFHFYSLLFKQLQKYSSTVLLNIKLLNSQKCMHVCVCGPCFSYLNDFFKSEWFISRSTSKRHRVIYGVCRREEEEGGRGEVRGASNTPSRMGCFGSLHVWCPCRDKLCWRRG